MNEIDLNLKSNYALNRGSYLHQKIESTKYDNQIIALVEEEYDLKLTNAMIKHELVLYEDGEKIQKHIIDMLVIAKEYVFIIDFKTDADINLRMDKYKLQLNRYYKLLKDYFQGENKVFNLCLINIKELKEDLSFHLIRVDYDDK